MGKYLLLFAIALLAQCTSVKKIPAAEVVILPRSAWNAAEPKPYRQHTLQRITVHHEGTTLKVTDDAAKKIFNIQRWGMGAAKNWADIPYHFLIAPDGTIYEGRAVNTVGETSTDYNPAGHLLICCLGNLEEQPLPESQRNALIYLLAYSCQQYKLSPDSIKGHKDYSAQTNCPGKNLYPLLQDGSLVSQVKHQLNQ